MPYMVLGMRAKQIGLHDLLNWTVASLPNGFLTVNVQWVVLVTIPCLAFYILSRTSN